MNRAPTSSPIVSKSRFFAGVDRAIIEDVLSYAQSRRVSSHSTLFSGGSRATHLFLLTGGRARFYTLTKSGEELTLLWAVPGHLLGLAVILPNPPAYMASVETMTPCELLGWDHATAHKLCLRYPQLTENGLRMALGYLRKYMDRHVSLVSKSAEFRLAEVVANLAVQAGEVHPAGVEIGITNEHLSSLSDVSPFTASRVLSQWEREGKVSKLRGRIIVRAPESLMVV
jgi:CRP-like cAMP-binding protein